MILKLQPEAMPLLNLIRDKLASLIRAPRYACGANKHPAVQNVWFDFAFFFTAQTDRRIQCSASISSTCKPFTGLLWLTVCMAVQPHREHWGRISRVYHTNSRVAKRAAAPITQNYTNKIRSLDSQTDEYRHTGQR